MKRLNGVLLLIFLFLAWPSRSWAMISLEVVSAKRAQELGVRFRSTPNGEAGVHVWIEFPTNGELKNFTYVELAVGPESKQKISAPLQTTPLSPGYVTTHFSAQPAYLPEITVMIVVYGGSRGGVGYRFKVSDHLQPTERR